METRFASHAFRSRFAAVAFFLPGFLSLSIFAVRAGAAAVTAGQAVTLAVTASGTAPFSYKWYKNGAAITGASGSTHAIASFQAAHAGTYHAVVTNSAGSTTSATATLTLGATQAMAPVITTQPASRTVTAGTTVTFTAAASGTPAPTYQWRKDGAAIAGATSASYAIASTTVTHAGTYVAVATNSAGAVTSNAAVLVVNPLAVAPVITIQPASQTVTAGTTVTFTAAATGTPTPTYQWRKDGTAINGATAASFSVANVAATSGSTYTVVATNSSGAATSSGAVLTVTSGPVAPPADTWQSADIGAVGKPGTSSENNGVVTLSGAGADIWGTADAFRFRSRTLTGDGAITVRVASAGNTHPWSKIGVMFREDLNAWSREVMAFVTPGHHASMQYRLALAGQTTQAADTANGVPVWLMLVRSGNTFGGYKSANGVDWTTLGSVNCVMPATIQVGLAISSHDPTRVNTATFDNLVIDSLAATPAGEPPAAPGNLTASSLTSASVNLAWSDQSGDETGFVIERALGSAGAFAEAGTAAANATSYLDSGLTPSTTFTYRLRARRGTVYSAYSNTALITTATAPPSNWVGVDIGTVGLAGSESVSDGTNVSVKAGGTDIWQTADGFRFVYQPWPGNGEITVRVDSLANTNAWAKAGVMFRAGLAANAPNVFVGLTPANGATFQVRATSGGASSEVRNSRTPRPPTWLRLTRAGNTFTAAFSSNGTTWTSLGSQTLALPANSYVGFGVTSHNTASATTAVFSNVQVR